MYVHVHLNNVTGLFADTIDGIINFLWQLSLTVSITSKGNTIYFFVFMGRVYNIQKIQVNLRPCVPDPYLDLLVVGPYSKICITNHIRRCFDQSM